MDDLDEIRHKWTSVRHIDHDKNVTDVICCDNCGLSVVWTNVDPMSDIHTDHETDALCGHRITEEVMGT